MKRKTLKKINNKKTKTQIFIHAKEIENSWPFFLYSTRTSKKIVAIPIVLFFFLLHDSGMSEDGLWLPPREGENNQNIIDRRGR